MRIIFWGTQGRFSHRVLQMLLTAGHTPCAIFLPNPDPFPRTENPDLVRLEPPAQPTEKGHGSLSLNLLNPRVQKTVRHTAWAHDIPVFAVRNLRSATVREQISALHAEVACVACFPWRVPTVLLALPRHGFLNVHPSLLPAHRGPAPLFWIFREGTQTTAGGVTIHWMDARFDTGPIAAQKPVPLPHGISGPAADAQCASVGGELLADVLHALEKGTIQPTLQPSGGSYESWPHAADFALDTSWSAVRAFNFMRGTAEWHQPYSIQVGEQTFWLRRAYAFDEKALLEQGWQRTGSVILVQCTPGVLTAELIQEGT